MGTLLWNTPSWLMLQNSLVICFQRVLCSFLTVSSCSVASAWEVLSQLWRAKLHRAEAGVTRAFVWFLFPRALGLSHSDFPLAGSVFRHCFSYAGLQEISDSSVHSQSLS